MEKERVEGATEQNFDTSGVVIVDIVKDDVKVTDVDLVEQRKAPAIPVGKSMSC